MSFPSDFHPTATFKVLQIAELLGRICEEVITDSPLDDPDQSRGSNDDKAALASIARVSKGFLQAALNALWYDIDTLEPLVCIGLPKGLLTVGDSEEEEEEGEQWEETYLEYDWKNIASYTRRTRVLRLGKTQAGSETIAEHPSKALTRLLDAMPTNLHLFPLVREVCLLHGTRRDELEVLRACAIAPVTKVIFTIRFIRPKECQAPGQMSHGLRNFLIGCGATLRKFELRWHHSADYYYGLEYLCIPEIFPRVMRHCRRLQSIDIIPECQTLDALVLLPDLKHLAVNFAILRPERGPHERQHPFQPVYVDDLELLLHDSQDVTDWILPYVNVFASRKLSVYIPVSYKARVPAINSILRTILRDGMSARLQSLELTLTHPISLDDETHFFRFSSFPALLELRMLCEVVIRTGCPLLFTNEDAAQIMEAWPSLREFHLGQRSRELEWDKYMAAFSEAGMDFRGLLSLADKCCDLRSVTVLVNTSSTTMLDLGHLPRRLVAPSLEELDVAYSPIDNEDFERVAAFLDAHFPKLVRIRSFDSELELAKQWVPWAEVAQLLVELRSRRIEADSDVPQTFTHTTGCRWHWDFSINRREPVQHHDGDEGDTFDDDEEEGYDADTFNEDEEYGYDTSFGTP